MMVWVQIGNSTNLGIFVLRLFFDIFVFFCDVVAARLVLLTVRVDHRGSVTTTRVAFSLHVAFLFTVTAHNIGIARTVAADWGRVGSRGPCGRGVEVVVVAGWLLTSDNSNLFDFVVGPFVPENGGGHTGLGSSGGLYHGSGGESLGFLFVECGCDGVKITTLVILTKVENAKVLTKTFYKTFLLSFFLFSVLTKTFHPNRCHH